MEVTIKVMQISYKLVLVGEYAVEKLCTNMQCCVCNKKSAGTAEYSHILIFSKNVKLLMNK